MDQIFGTVVPVFGLIGLGYLAVWVGLLRNETGDALGEFVFTIAIPVLLFRVVATADFSGGSPWLLWIAYYIAFAIAWAAGTLIVRHVFGRDHRAGLVAGVSSAYGNTLLVGVPLIIAAYGHEGTAAISLLIAVHLPVMMAASAVLIERALIKDGKPPDEDGRAIVRNLGLNLLKNPLVIGLFAGILWRLTGLPLSGPGGAVVNSLGDVAATLALVTVGMNLRRYGVSGNVQPSLVVAAIKLVAMPALLMVLLLYVIPLPETWARALVIAAACPTGVNAYAVAARFRTGQALASNAITLTTGLSVVTTAAWLTIVEWWL